MDQEVIAKSILDAAFKVHTTMGPGLLESVYEAAMAIELRKRGHKVERQVPIPVCYEGECLSEIGFRADLLVDSMVLVELKSVAEILMLFRKTTLNYLRLIPLNLGLLINFNEEHLKDGITRISNSRVSPEAVRVRAEGDRSNGG